MSERSIKLFTNQSGKIEVSDWYHTFSELYDHRQILFIKLCKSLAFIEKHLPLWEEWFSFWKSRLHSDGKMFDWMFIAWITFPDWKNATYHIDETRWYLCDHFQELVRAPERDWHTSIDVLSMLITL